MLPACDGANSVCSPVLAIARPKFTIEIIDFRASLFVSKRTLFTNGKQVFRIKPSRPRMVSRMRFVLAQILAHGRSVMDSATLFL